MRTSVVPSSGAKSPPHVVVIGNQKGGSGKSTFAMHIIVLFRDRIMIGQLQFLLVLPVPFMSIPEVPGEG